MLSKNYFLFSTLYFTKISFILIFNTIQYIRKQFSKGVYIIRMKIMLNDNINLLFLL